MDLQLATSHPPITKHIQEQELWWTNFFGVPVAAWGWYGVNYYNFQHARRQLEQQSNDAYVPIHTCKRVSCEKGSAITVCNDVSAPLLVHFVATWNHDRKIEEKGPWLGKSSSQNFASSFISTRTISNLAWSMWKYCRWDVKPKDPFHVGGQVFEYVLYLLLPSIWFLLGLNFSILDILVSRILIIVQSWWL